MKNLKHYPSTSGWDEGTGRKLYKSKCGLSELSFKEMVKTPSKLSCPDCILAFLTQLEEKIVELESRYEELYPGRPVGEKIQ